MIMKTYLVSVTQEVCADFEIEAETPAAAEKKALSATWTQMYSDDWCEVHPGSRKAVVVEEMEK